MRKTLISLSTWLMLASLTHFLITNDTIDNRLPMNWLIESTKTGSVHSPSNCPNFTTPHFIEKVFFNKMLPLTNKILLVISIHCIYDLRIIIGSHHHLSLSLSHHYLLLLSQISFWIFVTLARTTIFLMEIAFSFCF